MAHMVKEHFDSIHKLLNTVDSRPNNSEMKNEHASKKNDKSFTGTKSWDEAVDLFRNGYKDVLPKIQSGVSRNLKATATANRRNVRMGVVGYAPHVPNAILNLPNSMIYTESQPQKIKAISIYYSPTSYCGTDTQEFIDSGICMLSAINRLELSGVRVNLNVVVFTARNTSNWKGNEDCEITFATVKVKDFREHLDIQKLCFPVVHPSLFRRFGFRWLETSPDIKHSGWKFGYGCYAQDLEPVQGEMKENDYLIGLEMIKECGYSPEKLIEKLNIKK